MSECQEKDLPIIKDQWRNLMTEQLEEVLEEPYRIDVIRLQHRSMENHIFFLLLLNF